MELSKAKPVALTSAHEKMEFEITPFFPYLTRFSTGGAEKVALDHDIVAVETETRSSWSETVGRERVTRLRRDAEREQRRPWPLSLVTN